MTGRDKAPLFDAVIFTAGLHDTYRNRKFTSSDERVGAQAMEGYGDALADVLARLANLERLSASFSRWNNVAQAAGPGRPLPS